MIDPAELALLVGQILSCPIQLLLYGSEKIFIVLRKGVGRHFFEKVWVVFFSKMVDRPLARQDLANHPEQYVFVAAQGRSLEVTRSGQIYHSPPHWRPDQSA